MSRRYQSSTPVSVLEGSGGEPSKFRWRGCRYEVSAVLAHWVEALPWWVDRASGQAPAQRQVWRVEAIRVEAIRVERNSGTGTTGVYDLARSCGTWSLERVFD